MRMLPNRSTLELSCCRNYAIRQDGLGPQSCILFLKTGRTQLCNWCCVPTFGYQELSLASSYDNPLSQFVDAWKCSDRISDSGLIFIPPSTLVKITSRQSRYCHVTDPLPYRVVEAV